MIRSHVIKLDPTCKQEDFFRQCCGVSRKAFNVALEEWQKRYAAGRKVNEGGLRKWLNAEKRYKYPYMLEVPKAVVQQAVKNLGIAYQNFFASCKGKRAGSRMSPPDFRSLHKSKQSARLDNGPGTFTFDGCSVRLPKIGVIKTHEELRFDGRPLSVTLSFVGGRWWLSVQVELPDPPVDTRKQKSVGIDLGLTTAVTLSTGEKFDAPKPLAAALERLKRLGQSVHRKVKGSANRKKAVQRLARLHWKIGQIRKDWQHKMTSAIAKRFTLVCVEDLHVKGMMKNHRLARAISDIGWAEIARQLKYKCRDIQEVGRFYPSSKLCSDCGTKTDVIPAGPTGLAVREWTCSVCGSSHDRDHNAALNIRKEGRRLFTASCAGINACGDGSSGSTRKGGTKLPSAKQDSRRI